MTHKINVVETKINTNILNLCVVIFLYDISFSEDNNRNGEN